MFFFNIKIWTLAYEQEEQKQNVLIWALDPLIITRRIWQKSPPNTIVIPPKGWEVLWMSWKSLSTTFRQCFFFIGSSFQIRKFAWWSITTYSDCLQMEQIDVLWMLMGILKVMCTMRPPINKIATIPKEAIDITIIFWIQSLVVIYNQLNVVIVLVHLFSYNMVTWLLAPILYWNWHCKKSKRFLFDWWQSISSIR